MRPVRQPERLHEIRGGSRSGRSKYRVQQTTIGALRLAASATNFRIGAHTRRNRSNVGVAGPAARMLSPSPNATNSASSATRREAGVTGFDCGAGDVLLGAIPPAGGRVPTQITLGGPRPLLSRGAHRGTGRHEAYDADARQSGGTSAKRVGSRSPIASVRPGNSSPTTAHHARWRIAAERRETYRPQPSRRTSDAVARRGKRPADVAFQRTSPGRRRRR